MSALTIHPHPSPNFGDRRGGVPPSLILIHYTAMSSAQAALDRLCDPAFEVSAHYLIARNGAVFGLVAEDKRAWHAGAGRWNGVDDINSAAIGVEIDNDGHSPFAAAAIDALEQLLPSIMSRWAIPARNVLGHSDTAPGRKIDPGPRFDWARLERQGLAQIRRVDPMPPTS